ncbi:hypothetical protein ACIRRA_11385 [Nocardia sp. NPDC101769]|uniref:hypothetical protein n=1 Tax=Nocardia sp. NPDC101769 TaxID=3364333 RepID=UPI00381C3A48
MSGTIRRVGIGIAAVVTAAAGLAAITESTAEADITNNGVTLVGDTFVVGQTYTVNASDGYCGDDMTPILLEDYVAIAQGTVTRCATASFQWTPKTAGPHRLGVQFTSHTTLGAVNVTVTTQSPTTTPPTTTPPTTSPNSGSANSIPVIGGLLSSLSAK